MKCSFSFIAVAYLAGLAATLPVADPDKVARAASPTVTLSLATVIGSVADGVNQFGGIPIAAAPTGSLRLKPPQAITSSIGVFDATGAAGACPQMLISTDSNNFITEVLGDIIDLPFFQTATGISEDCLTISVQVPSGTKADAKLPVLFWIFGGGFELGWSSMYDGVSLVNNGVAQGKPFVFVAVNYRVGGFGFLGGKEILADGSSNLGLLDQRLGLEWVADNIAAFGGDPTKVTIWGESAGSISVLDQMVLYGGDIEYKGKPLFRGAIMDSGSVVPADPVDCPKAQAVYDQVVSKAGCSSASDTLECLRSVDYETFLNAANSVPGILSYSSVALSYLPRPDGVVLPSSPDVLITNKQYAAVPMIIGDQEDEGTLFALFQSNITDSSLIVSYLSEYFFHSATTAQLTALVATYPDNWIDGSPFNTGLLNAIYPEFKRLAAMIGDFTFTLTRRLFLAETSTLNPTVPSWSYLASYDYGTPILGTFHGSDLLQVFYGILPDFASASIQSYYLSFLYTLDPNNGTSDSYRTWPQWSVGQELINFSSGSSSLMADNFRSESYDWIAANVANLHI